MTSTDTDLLELTATLRKALGSGGEQPAVDDAWRDTWPVLAEIGIPALCVAEDSDGLGHEVPAALAAARELGAALHGSAYPAVAAAGYALSRGSTPELRDTVSALTAGTHLPALAFLTPGATVSDHPDGPRVDGPAYQVAGGADADSFLVLPADGDTMLLVRRGDTHEAPRTHTFDVTRSCADVAFTAEPALPVAAPPGVRSRAELLYRLLLVGDTLGGLRRMLDRTIAYSRGRTAFGKAIGGFQAVQHRLVDHTVRVRGMGLLADEAAARLAADAPDAERAVLLAEAATTSDAVPLLHDLVQLTGAIGFTWEYGLHLYERRAHHNARLAHSPRHALLTLARNEGWAS